MVYSMNILGVKWDILTLDMHLHAINSGTKSGWAVG